MRTLRSLFLGLLFLAPLAGFAAQPNIILIMADDLGHGYLGSYGQTKIKTPNLDRLAAEGMRFTWAYSGSAVCAPARSTLMTGMHTGHTPIRNNFGGNTLQPEDVTVAEVLKGAGYATGGFGKWGLGLETSPGVPVKQGFDTWVGQYSQVHAHFFYPWFVWKDLEKLPLPENEGQKQGRYVHDVSHEYALKFIEQNGKAGKPFFAYLPYIVPHVELVVPEEDEVPYRDAGWPKLDLPDPRPGYVGSKDAYVTYAGMVSRLDRHVGEVMKMVESLGIQDNTLIIFTSDNGAQGATWRPLIDFFGGSGNLRGDKGELLEGGIRDPLLVRWPGKIKPGTVTDLPVYFPDVLPTLAETAGVSKDTWPKGIDGISFLPTLLGSGEQARHEFMYWEIGRDANLSQAVRHGNWKAYRKNQQTPWALFDLATDEGEAKNVAKEHPEEIAAIEAFIAKDRTEPRVMPAGPKEGWQDYKR